MGLLRVTAVALVACSAAGAEPTVAPSREAIHPEGWKQLPSIATAVGAAAKADGVTVDAVDAWGEPANGCYAVWLALHGKSGDAPALADQVLAGLGQLQISELVKPAGPAGVLSLAFASAPYRGRVRAQLGAGRIDAVACFGNRRAPLACDRACVRVLEGTP
jgi:hypothetical protein